MSCRYKTETALTKQGHQGQKRDIGYKTGTSGHKTGTFMGKVGKPIVLDYL